MGFILRAYHRKCYIVPVSLSNYRIFHIDHLPRPVFFSIKRHKPNYMLTQSIIFFPPLHFLQIHQNYASQQETANSSSISLSKPSNPKTAFEHKNKIFELRIASIDLGHILNLIQSVKFIHRNIEMNIFFFSVYKLDEGNFGFSDIFHLSESCGLFEHFPMDKVVDLVYLVKIVGNYS